MNDFTLFCPNLSYNGHQWYVHLPYPTLPYLITGPSTSPLYDDHIVFILIVNVLFLCVCGITDVVGIIFCGDRFPSCNG